MSLAEKKTIYEKLQNARTDLSKLNLKKSGVNEYSKYDYFELGDFLSHANDLANKHRFTPVVTYDDENATMTMYDWDSDATIVFKSPMRDASLKGCHPIQNLGAVETYQRRYLYMTAFEIVERELLDATTGKEDVPKEPKRSAAKVKADENIVAAKGMVGALAQELVNELGVDRGVVSGAIKELVIVNGKNTENYNKTDDINVLRNVYSSLLKIKNGLSDAKE
mgnify:CR=1 FL=1